ncbi:hypothetical protein [Asticcacaulis excentricus]|uniref:Uncharacterized protein n=1 Tax=Asticcacaulis excentricus TaxID=78587 RepID=A0A3G9G610_9CAUL|nr:hypothetical protein [Asticcacaulis excentricus]BBF79659.1 hypothetical protein EM6_0228 [Asticcacaulis excentricus]
MKLTMAITVTALIALTTPVQAGTVGAITRSEINQAHLDGCGTTLYRTPDFEKGQAPIIWHDDFQTGLMRWNGQLVTLTLQGKPKSSVTPVNQFVSADGDLRVTQTLKVTKRLGEEWSNMAGTLTLTQNGKSQSVTVYGQSGC